MLSKKLILSGVLLKINTFLRSKFFKCAQNFQCIKTWLLLPYSPDWRWFLELKNSPWYELVKLYRQEEFNKWDSIFVGRNF